MCDITYDIYKLAKWNHYLVVIAQSQIGWFDKGNHDFEELYNEIKRLNDDAKIFTHNLYFAKKTMINEGIHSG